MARNSMVCPHRPFRSSFASRRSFFNNQRDSGVCKECMNDEIEVKHYDESDLLHGSKISPSLGLIHRPAVSPTTDKRMADVDDLIAKPSGLSEEEDDCDGDEIERKFFTPMIIQKDG